MSRTVALLPFECILHLGHTRPLLVIHVWLPNSVVLDLAPIFTLLVAHVIFLLIRVPLTSFLLFSFLLNIIVLFTVFLFVFPIFLILASMAKLQPRVLKLEAARTLPSAYVWPEI